MQGRSEISHKIGEMNSHKKEAGTHVYTSKARSILRNITKISNWHTENYPWLLCMGCHVRILLKESRSSFGCLLAAQWALVCNNLNFPKIYYLSSRVTWRTRVSPDRPWARASFLTAHHRTACSTTTSGGWFQTHYLEFIDVLSIVHLTRVTLSNEILPRLDHMRPDASFYLASQDPAPSESLCMHQREFRPATKGV